MTYLGDPVDVSDSLEPHGGLLHGGRYNNLDTRGLTRLVSLSCMTITRHTKNK